MPTSALSENETFSGFPEGKLGIDRLQRCTFALQKYRADVGIRPYGYNAKQQFVELQVGDISYLISQISYLVFASSIFFLLSLRGCSLCRKFRFIQPDGKMSKKIVRNPS